MEPCWVGPHGHRPDGVWRICIVAWTRNRHYSAMFSGRLPVASVLLPCPTADRLPSGSLARPIPGALTLWAGVIHPPNNSSASYLMTFVFDFYHLPCTRSLLLDDHYPPRLFLSDFPVAVTCSAPPSPIRRILNQHSLDRASALRLESISR